MKKIIIVIMAMVLIMVSVTVNRVETKVSFPISRDARGNSIGVTIYAGISTGGQVYVEKWMQEPWATEVAFHDEMVNRFTPNTIRASIFYRFDDGTVECENDLLKPHVDEMLNVWAELWEDELDPNLVEQIKAAALYWESMWG